MHGIEHRIRAGRLKRGKLQGFGYGKAVVQYQCWDSLSIEDFQLVRVCGWFDKNGAGEEI